MRAFVTDGDGRAWELPAAQNWELEFGTGTPCDSFFLRTPWAFGQETPPRDWAGFYAEHEGARVFTGVVDECEVSLDSRGCVLEISGRGMAALLLDNEAVGQDYQTAALADILEDHVVPYGIGTVGGAPGARLSGFRVDTGSSEWTVLEEFLRGCALPEPRFDPWGRLVLEQETGERLVLDDSSPIQALNCREKRYGVLSEVLVRERYSGRVCSVKNERFCAAAGRARRVLTMPGRADAGDMERSGREQLERSARGSREVEVTLPAPFYALPGRGVELARTGCDANGAWRVRRSVCGMDETGYWTRLVLWPEEE